MYFKAAWIVLVTLLFSCAAPPPADDFLIDNEIPKTKIEVPKPKVQHLRHRKKSKIRRKCFNAMFLDIQKLVEENKC